MADKLIAQTPEGDKLYQVGATSDPAIIGLPPTPMPSYGFLEPQPVFAYGYVRYADGRTISVPYIQSFLGHGFFEQVAEIDLTITDN